MSHSLSADDRAFRADFEEGRVSPERFDHRAHVRLAYIHLAGSDADTAQSLMRDSLLAFLRFHGVDAGKYHDTITRAWILAVRHFMELTPSSASADAFIDQNPMLLDSKIMLTHYSAEVLFSPEARARFVEPDIDPIPRHDADRKPRRLECDRSSQPS